MPELSRRNVIRGAAVTGAAAAASAAPATKALAAPGNPSAARKGGNGHPHGDLRDIKHIVVPKGSTPSAAAHQFAQRIDAFVKHNPNCNNPILKGH